MKNSASLMVAIVAVLASGVTWAQSARPVIADTVDLDAARQQAAKALGQFDARAAKKQAAENAKAPQQKPLAAPVVIQRKELLGNELQTMIEDFNQAKRNPGGGSGKGQPGQDKRAAGLYVFVSFAMPQGVLKELSRQTAQAGGVMVLRGFAKTANLAETVRRAEEMNDGAQWQIDPELFRTFGISQVPAVAVANRLPTTTQCGEAEVCEDGWDAGVVYGDQSLHESLRRIASSKNSGIANLAKAYRTKLEGGR